MGLYTTNDYQKKIEPAFEQLRKAGYFAEQDFMCCQSCGWASVPEEQEDKAVFYHEQDKEDLEFGSVLLAWSGNGQEIVDILSEHINSLYFKVNWNGLDTSRIEIKF